MVRGIRVQKATSVSLPWDLFVAAADSPDYATGLTHPLYRYPARMSPYLARALVLELTKPGDIILDPFCGGGTTAVEALYHGRRVVCCDLNSLACFVTKAKAWPVSSRALGTYRQYPGDDRENSPREAQQGY